MTAIPPYLRPKATKLPAGHDDTLDPPEPPTDPEKRSAPPTSWPAVDTSRGSDKPPDPPAAAPFVPPPVRSSAPSARQPAAAAPPGRAVALAIPVPDIDPDLEFWPVVSVRRWPFTGPPTRDIWPIGYFGIDNTGTPYVCTQGGSPGTWQALPVGSVLTLPTPSAAGEVFTSTGNAQGDWGWAIAGFSWVNMTPLLNSWAVQASGVARYVKIGLVVYIEAQVQGGSSAGVFTLPAGYRPSTHFAVPAVVANSGIGGTGQAQVDMSGNLSISNSDGSTPTSGTAWLSYPADA